MRKHEIDVIVAQASSAKSVSLEIGAIVKRKDRILPEIVVMTGSVGMYTIMNIKHIAPIHTEKPLSIIEGGK